MKKHDIFDLDVQVKEANQVQSDSLLTVGRVYKCVPTVLVLELFS